MNRLRRTLIATALAFASSVALTPARAQTPQQPLVVYAAASLKNALDEAGAAYARTGRPAPVVSYAASSTLARQIEQGATADVFVSADADWVDYLSARGLIRSGSRRDLLTNRLALITPANSKATLKLVRNAPLATALGAGRLAMAGPDVPAGRYGQAALTSLGLWPSVSGKTAYAENVRAAMVFVAREEAPLGVVYDTDALVEPKVRIVALFPEGSHPRIVYPAGIVARSSHPQAQAYLQFLGGAQARAIFVRYGFKPLAAAAR